MKVRWTVPAVAQLTAIYEYISLDSPRYAARTVDRITAHSGLLGGMPEMGAIVPDFSAQVIRQLVEGSYRIIYRVRDQEVQILAVIHGARLLPKDLPSDT